MLHRWRVLIVAVALTIFPPALRAQKAEPPGMPYFKIDGDADKVAPAFAWWFELTSPPEYDRWWHEISACEKLPLPDDYKKVRFFVVNAKSFHAAKELADTTSTETSEAVGYVWHYAPPEIWLALPLRMLEWMVKHEMTHLLMMWAGEEPGHPPERFETCGLHTVYDPGLRIIETR